MQVQGSYTQGRDNHQDVSLEFQTITIIGILICNPTNL